MNFVRKDFAAREGVGVTCACAAVPWRRCCSSRPGCRCARNPAPRSLAQLFQGTQGAAILQRTVNPVLHRLWRPHRRVRARLDTLLSLPQSMATSDNLPPKLKGAVDDAKKIAEKHVGRRYPPLAPDAP